MAQQYFYDQQIRRWLLQFMRLFGGFSVRMGRDANGADIFHEVPVRYGDTSRMAAHIVNQNSENKMNTVPFISVYITELLPNAERRMNPSHIEAVQVYEKAYDPTADAYLDQVGSSYTLERHAPIPYDLSLNVDIWTSNTEQKLQLLEQILLLFNPSVNLQSSQNPFDWTSLGVVEMINITWSARSIPQGADEVIDVASLIFQLPIFLTPPAMIKRQVLIHSILASSYTDTNLDTFDPLAINNAPQRQWITFQNRHIQVNSDSVQLLNHDNTPQDREIGDGTYLSWTKHLEKYGGVRPGITEIRIRITDDPIVESSIEVILKLDEVVPSNPNLVRYTLVRDTLPPDTIPMVNGIIDPTRSRPGIDNIPAASFGQRYILVNKTIPGSYWGNIVANENDIIEFNGIEWVVAFSASAVNVTGYTTNANTMAKLFYTGTQWVDAVEGIFEEGFWRIVL